MELTSPTFNYTRGKRTLKKVLTEANKSARRRRANPEVKVLQVWRKAAGVLKRK